MYVRRNMLILLPTVYYYMDGWEQYYTALDDNTAEQTPNKSLLACWSRCDTIDYVDSISQAVDVPR